MYCYVVLFNGSAVVALLHCYTGVIPWKCIVALIHRMCIVTLLLFIGNAFMPLLLLIASSVSLLSIGSVLLHCFYSIEVHC